MTKPKIAVEPLMLPQLQEAVEAAGGEVAEPKDADGIVWINPRDPDGLKELLASSSARWVQLPFAGIESFFEAGVIDPALTWTCTKGAYGPATAEHALALMLALARRIQEHVNATEWVADFAQFGRPEQRLKDAFVVIIGTGGIGSALAAMLEPLGARVIGVNRSGKPMDGAVRTVTSNELLDVLPEADFLAIAAASTPETDKLIGAKELAAMKDTAFLVNVARGTLVDTDALVTALKKGAIQGAGLDVTDPEPLPEGHPLWEFDNVIVTPHVANTPDMAVPELTAMVRRNVEHFAKGEELEGLVDVALGY